MFFSRVTFRILFLKVSGTESFDVNGHIVQISLNQAHELAASFIAAFAFFLAHDGTTANLRPI